MLELYYIFLVFFKTIPRSFASSSINLLFLLIQYKRKVPIPAGTIVTGGQYNKLIPDTAPRNALFD
jgi:hypothetical protein